VRTPEENVRLFAATAKRLRDQADQLDPMLTAQDDGIPEHAETLREAAALFALAAHAWEDDRFNALAHRGIWPTGFGMTVRKRWLQRLRLRRA
jgi:hypothetical protein